MLYIGLAMILLALVYAFGESPKDQEDRSDVK